MRWRVPHLARSFPQAWRVNANATMGIHNNAAMAASGVNFYVPVDYYDLVNRAAKYGLMFLAVAFMAVFVLEDLQSAIEVMVFPRTMLDYGAYLADDAVVCVKGRIDMREEPAKIICMELKRPDLSPEHSRPVRIKLDPHVLTPKCLAQLKEVLREHPGSQPVLVHLDSTILRLPDEFRVDETNGLRAEHQLDAPHQGADGSHVEIGDRPAQIAHEAPHEPGPVLALERNLLVVDDDGCH